MLTLYTEYPDEVKDNDGFYSHDKDNNEYNHSIAFGTEICHACKAKLKRYTDLVIDSTYSATSKQERVYCFDCITFKHTSQRG